MPRYVYRCEKCDNVFEYYHSISDKKKQCEVCNQETLLKLPYFSGTIKKEAKQQVGTIVENYIKETREEIQREKQEKKKLEFKPE